MLDTESKEKRLPLNNTTSGMESLARSNEEERPKGGVRLCYTFSFCFVISLGMFMFGKKIVLIC